MSLDKIVVFVMALAFFGGLAYVAWKGKQKKKEGGRASSLDAIDRAAGDSLNKPQKKESKISKS